jgi:hypothetical protein
MAIAQSIYRLSYSAHTKGINISKKKIQVIPVYNIKAYKDRKGITPPILHHGNIQSERLTSGTQHFTLGK